MAMSDDVLAAPAALPGMVGDSAAMRELAGVVRRLAPFATSVLVTGETGTGKELVARALHALGPRSSRPFVAVNCSAIVDTLFESELFGHVRGAFTGATEHRVGFIERAQGGVLLLDEVGELLPGMQAKLLRVLETGEVTRVGASDSRRVDVQVIAATNRDLAEDVRTGRFRADLYYRLHVAGVHVPALRHRRDDIAPLVHWFAGRFAAKSGRTADPFQPAAIAALMSLDWPGNVRELRNVVERAVMLAGGAGVDAADVDRALVRPAAPPAAASGLRRVRRIADLERDAIAQALDDTRGNKKEAARRLGLSRRALYRRLEKFGLAA
jgi:DNA-binding NtrC family response regulator